jgi:hypothetical protein
MLSLILALAVVSPTPLHQCMTACVNDGRYGDGTRLCWYELRTSCTARNPECVDSDELICKPTSVSLGTISQPRDWDGTSLPPPPPVEATPTLHYNNY